MSDAKIFYFGAIGYAGHYLWKNALRPDYSRTIEHPWEYEIDGGLPPQDNKSGKEGAALLHHKDGWTAISFWDRSVDRRGGSHSTYIINKILSFKEMVALAQMRFPARWAIMDFEVTEQTRTKGTK